MYSESSAAKSRIKCAPTLKSSWSAAANALFLFSAVDGMTHPIWSFYDRDMSAGTARCLHCGVIKSFRRGFTTANLETHLVSKGHRSIFTNYLKEKTAWRQRKAVGLSYLFK